MPLTYTIVNGILKVDIFITINTYLIILSTIAYYNELYLSILFMKIIERMRKMDNDFMLIPTVMLNKLAITEILNCNEITSRYGLLLSKAQAQDLVVTRVESLSGNGRIEFAGGIINKLIIEFCDSPFISQYNYANTLNELIEIFYYFKNETLDEISDDDLILLMKEYFDVNCKGSIELLQNRELEALAHNIRYGVSDYEDVYKDEYEDAYEYENQYEDMENFYGGQNYDKEGNYDE